MDHIPDHIRTALDKTYNEIRHKSKARKKQKLMQRSIAAAIALILIGTMATNDQIQAGFAQLFFSNDRGAQLAIDQGFVQEEQTTVSDEDIHITIDQHFYDGRKFGMSLSILFDEATQLEQIVDVTLDYRLVNGDGTYLLEMIPDTKPLKGDGNHYFQVGQDKSVIHQADGFVQLELLSSAIGGKEAPSLYDSVLQIETVKLWHEDGTFHHVDGQWNLPLSKIDQANQGDPVQYKAANGDPSIRLMEATAHPTSLFVQFELDGDLSGQYLQIQIRTENDEMYDIGGYQTIVTDEQTTVISGNFPISKFENLEKMTLHIGSIGEVQLVKEE